MRIHAHIYIQAQAYKHKATVHLFIYSCASNLTLLYRYSGALSNTRAILLHMHTKVRSFALPTLNVWVSETICNG